jgi:hypothetical protein
MEFPSTTNVLLKLNWQTELKNGKKVADNMYFPDLKT